MGNKATQAAAFVGSNTQDCEVPTEQMYDHRLLLLGTQATAKSTFRTFK
jgi:hypothetical protein